MKLNNLLKGSKIAFVIILSSLLAACGTKESKSERNTLPSGRISLTLTPKYAKGFTIDSPQEGVVLI